ncbi:MAG: phospho-N-acetylmuramoyl-pentapeptide-transferase [Patescibacteria group bacterium]
MIINIIKVFTPSAIAFLIGIGFAPVLISYLYKHKMWKKKSGKVGMDGKDTPIFNKLHKGKEVGTPKMGGILIWGSVILTTLLFLILPYIFNFEITSKLDFFSRNQTWLPLFTLLVGAVIGLIDDYFEVKGKKDHLAGGLSLKKRLLVVFVVSLIGAWWFYSKLEMTSVAIPLVGDLDIGLLFIPFFIIVMLGIYSGGVIDGIDGLAGGVFSSAFSAYGVIAFVQNQVDLATFSFVIVGGLLAFLWFNIPPARFYMSETGSMALTMTLAVVAFLTKEVLVLPIIAFPLVITTLSDIIQILSKKLRGKKIFLVAPIHHHFEAKGWPGYKVTMRYWVISVVFAFVGVIIALLK